jgi:hypothetical protein
MPNPSNSISGKDEGGKVISCSTAGRGSWSIGDGGTANCAARPKVGGYECDSAKG